ncbi:MAG TPA: redoxin domain-containing protein [Fibrobacteraceae bacterium]|nr:redoxin domain-containing protein [Fibrobacteraceae bacterium]
MVKTFWSCILLGICVQAWAAATPWLGFNFHTTGGSAGQPCTLEVAGVYAESGAAKAKLEKGDRVIQINGQAIQSLGWLQGLMKHASVGQKMDLALLRKGQERKVQLQLTARPDDIRNFMGSHVGSKAYPLGKKFYANAQTAQAKPKVILLDFWATWCGPCRAAIPTLRSIYSRYHAQGLEIIGVSSDELRLLQAFQEQEKEPWPLLHDPGGLQSSRWGVQGIPTLILLDQSQVVLRQWTGLPPSGEIENAVRKALETK